MTRYLWSVGRPLRYAPWTLMVALLLLPASAWAGADDNEAATQQTEAKKETVPNPYAGMSAGDVQDAEEGDEDEGEKKPESPFVPGAGAMVSMLLWLGLIVVMIYGGVYVFRRYVPSARNMFGGGAMKIIGRTYLGPKTYILLVKVGSRLVMVGVTGNGMSPLAEITDRGEITEITNEMAATSGPLSGAFGKVLNRRRDEIDEYEVEETDDDRVGAGISGEEDRDADVRDMRRELDTITQKMNWWRSRD